MSQLCKILQEKLMDNSLDIREKKELGINTIILDEKLELSCRMGH